MTDTEQKQKKKKRTSAPLILVLLVLLVLLALTYLPNIGFDFGGGEGGTPLSGGGTESSSGTAEAPPQREEPAAERALDRSLDSAQSETEAETEIRVSENVISAEGQTFEDAAALGAYLEERRQDGARYLLVDAHALQQTYASVKAELERLALDYSETLAEGEGET